MKEFVDSFQGEIDGGVEHKNLRGIPANSSLLLNAICAKNKDLEFLIEELDTLSSRKYLEEEFFDPNPIGSGTGFKARDGRSSEH